MSGRNDLKMSSLEMNELREELMRSIFPPLYKNFYYMLQCNPDTIKVQFAVNCNIRSVSIC